MNEEFEDLGFGEDLPEETPVVEPKRKKKKSTLIHEGSDKPLAPKSQHYVDNDAFYKALVERKAQVQKALQDGLPKPKPSDFIGLCILKIANNLAKKYNFSHSKYFPYKDQMIDDGVENCIRYLDSFNPDVTKNPFSYFTTTCYYAFIRRIEIEDEEMAKKYKYTLESAVLQELCDHSGMDDTDQIQVEVSMQNMEEFVKAYDAKIAARKENARKKQVEKLKGLENFMEPDDE